MCNHNHYAECGYNHENRFQHRYEHGNEHAQLHSHEKMVDNKEEAIAYLQFTLHHNAHHEKELSDLAEGLRRLKLEKEADEILLCIDDLSLADRHLEAVLAMLKK